MAGSGVGELYGKVILDRVEPSLTRFGSPAFDRVALDFNLLVFTVFKCLFVAKTAAGNLFRSLVPKLALGKQGVILGSQFDSAFSPTTRSMIMQVIAFERVNILFCFLLLVAVVCEFAIAAHRLTHGHFVSAYPFSLVFRQRWLLVFNVGV